MKVRITFYVDDETRRAIARENDGDTTTRRKATREEIEGKIHDGAECSLEVVTFSYGDDRAEAELERMRAGGKQ